MNLKSKLSKWIKYAACVAAVSMLVGPGVGDAEAQQHQQRSRVRTSHPQRVVNTAPKLLSTNVSSPEQTAVRPAVSPRSPQASAGRTFVPSHLRSSGVKQVSYANSRFANGQIIGGESVIDGGGCGAGGCNGGCGAGGCGGEVIYEDGGYLDGGCGGGCGDGGCGGCGDIGCADGGCGYGFEDPCGYARYPSLISLSDIEYFGGVQAFKGPINLGEGGSFGFHEGLNFGFPFPLFQGMGLSGQLGARLTQSNGNGGGFTTDRRDQFFLTGGVFRRVDYGLQMGVAYDYLQDDWYFKGTYGQLRGDISWVGAYGNTIGFRYTTDMEEEPGTGAIARSLNPVVGTFNTFTPVETYRIYLQRKLSQSGGIIDVFGGFSSQSQGMLGGDLVLPIAERLLLKSTATLLIDDSAGVDANIDESWNIGMGVVFVPKGWSAWKRAYHRPMFNVADNGTFLFGRN